MTETVGVVAVGPSGHGDLKREGLYFDRLALVHRTASVDGQMMVIDTEEDEYRHRYNTARWLTERGLAFAVTEWDGETPATTNPELAALHTEFEDITSRLKEKFPVGNLAVTRGQLAHAMLSIAAQTESLDVRRTALWLRKTKGIDAYPVLDRISTVDIDQVVSKRDVVEVVLRALPLPSESTSWEAIMEFREDTDAQEALRALRQWTVDVARLRYSVREAQDMCEHLLARHQRYMELHRLEHRPGTVASVIAAGVDIVADIASLNWSHVPEALFFLRQRKLGLLKAELQSPGAQVAFIARAEEKFGG